MKISFDQQADAMYIQFQKGKSKNTVKLKNGILIDIDKKGKLQGIFTDGDLRRHFRENGSSILTEKIQPLATRNPTTIEQSHLAAEALQLLRDHKIDEIPVVDHKGRAVGLVDVQDLLKAGFV